MVTKYQQDLIPLLLKSLIYVTIVKLFLCSILFITKFVIAILELSYTKNICLFYYVSIRYTSLFITALEKLRAMMYQHRTITTVLILNGFESYN